jgi:hypothetical protein
MVINQVMEFTAAEDLKPGDAVILDEDGRVCKVRASDLPVINRFVHNIAKPVKENETFRREDWY